MTDESALKTVLRLLPTLQPDELQAVSGRLAALGQLSGASVHTAFVLEAIVDQLASLGVDKTTVPLLSKPTDKEFVTFRSHVPSLMSFVRKTIRNRTGQRALLQLGVRLLYENLTKMDIPVSGRTVRRHVHRLPSVLNQAFPNYSRSGILGMVVSRETGICSDVGAFDMFPATEEYMRK